VLCVFPAIPQLALPESRDSLILPYFRCRPAVIVLLILHIMAGKLPYDTGAYPILRDLEPQFELYIKPSGEPYLHC